MDTLHVVTFRWNNADSTVGYLPISVMAADPTDAAKKANKELPKHADKIKKNKVTQAAANKVGVA